MNLTQIRKNAEKQIQEANLVLGALEILEAKMADKPKEVRLTIRRTQDASPQPQDGQFTLAQFAAKEGLEKIQARKTLNALVTEGKVEIVQKGKGRRPTLYKNVNAE